MQLYDKRNGVFSDVPPVTDPTPKMTPGQPVDIAPEQILPDFSKPPAGFVPGPLPQPAPAVAPVADPPAPDNTTADPSTPV